MNYFKNKYEAYRVSQKEKAEQERIQRNKHHPHKQGCTQSRDIELFDKKFNSFDFGTIGGNFSVLTDYKSRCQECGCCSDKNGEELR